MPLIPRVHLFEIDDQQYFPPALRECVQSLLAVAWNIRLPVLQPTSAAAVAGDILLKQLPDAGSYTFIDVCAGAGGPTPTIERRVNNRLQAHGQGPVRFCLTDIHPHLTEWRRLSKRSSNLDFVAEPVDATAARGLTQGNEKECRMFNLAFHHLDDTVARSVLADAMDSADAIAIFELQDRTLGSFFNITIAGLLSILITPLYFWHSAVHLFFAFVIPIVPFVLIFDGYISSLRTRTPKEVIELMPKETAARKNWTFEAGKVMVLPPFAYLHWFVGVRNST